jgi:hypothetical protein
MRSAFRTMVAAITVLALVLAQTGCVTSKKYKMVKDGAPPARSLGWNVSAPPAELTLATLIVFKGPGSWKREARWDEYVVVIANHGAEPLLIEAAVLIDLLGQPQVPGVDPWQVEKLSYTNWDKYGKNGLKLLAGAGVVALYAAASFSVAMSGLSFGGTAAAASGGTVILNIIPVLAVLDIAVVALVNNANKKLIVAEFNRRRLQPPVTIAPGQSVSGSFFFPMTPGPQRLILKGKAGEAPLELVLDLKLLAGLHLKPAEKR